jgi:hypothetical protein
MKCERMNMTSGSHYDLPNHVTCNAVIHLNGCHNHNTVTNAFIVMEASSHIVSSKVKGNLNTEEVSVSTVLSALLLLPMPCQYHTALTLLQKQTVLFLYVLLLQPCPTHPHSKNTIKLCGTTDSSVSTSSPQ